ncbi:MAG: GNAT family N-acetyltransferase [Pyrinomonadaceae bacterium]
METARSIRRISRDEWKQWCDVSNLPITCDQDWADSLETGYDGKYKAKAFLLDYNEGDELLIVYKDDCRPLSRLHLSPFGLYCGIARRGQTPRYQETLATFFKAYPYRYRSAYCCLPFFGTSVLSGRAVHVRSENYSTHVLDLDSSYGTLFSTRFKGATRTCLRRAESTPMEIEISRDKADIESYYELHRRLAIDKGGYGELHPLKFFIDLISRCDRSELAVVRINSQIVSGGIFLDDGPSVFYWHGATDRDYAALQPNYALLRMMIKRALARGKTFFNFGGSSNLESLERFKESWGATKRYYEVSHITNPIARRVKTLVKSIQH